MSAINLLETGLDLKIQRRIIEEYVIPATVR
jgi:hypothetical protein